MNIKVVGIDLAKQVLALLRLGELDIRVEY